jgi:Astacin (Peptidase family M12A)
MQNTIARLVTVLALTALVGGCTTLRQPDGMNGEASQSVVRTASFAVTATNTNSAALTPENAERLKRTGVVVEHTFSNKKTLRFRNITDIAVYDGDMGIVETRFLPEFVTLVERELARKPGSKPQSISLNPSGCSGWFIGCINPTSNYLWSTKFIPYEFENTVTPAQQAAITASVNSWNAKTNLTVQWRHISSYTGPDRSVIFKSVDAGGQYCGLAYIGYQGRVISAPFARDFINLNNNVVESGNCFDDRTIHHEMGHVLGLPHEQNRCDRNQYVTLVSPYATDPLCGGDFTTWNRGFDFASIMLYDNRFVRPKRNASGSYIGNLYYTGDPSRDINNTVLSSTDINTINSLYAGR